MCQDSVRDQAVRPEKGEVQTDQRRIHTGDDNSGGSKGGERANS